MEQNYNINLKKGDSPAESEALRQDQGVPVESEYESKAEHEDPEFFPPQDQQDDKSKASQPRRLTSALDDLSDRLNNKFDMMDVRKKGIILLSAAAVIFIMGMVYLYIFLSNLL